VDSCLRRNDNRESRNDSLFLVMLAVLFSLSCSRRRASMMNNEWIPASAGMTIGRVGMTGRE